MHGKDGEQVKIVLGAGTTLYEGWISTNENDLSLIRRNAWYQLKR
jgi:hypothetical protein